MSTQTAHVDAPADEVFALLSDPARWPELEPGLVMDEVHVTPELVGTSYRWHATVGGVPLVRGSGCFTEVVAGRRIVDTASPSWQGTWTCEVVPEASGSRVVARHESAWLLRVPLVGELLDRLLFGHGRQLQRLQALLET